MNQIYYIALHKFVRTLYGDLTPTNNVLELVPGLKIIKTDLNILSIYQNKSITGRMQSVDIEIVISFFIN